MEHERNLKFAVAKGVVGLALGTIVLATQSLASPLQEQSDRVIVALDPTAPLANRSGHAAAISPDGSSVVYVGERQGEQYLYLYSLEDRSTRVIAGSERVRRGPIFSSDGKSLAFSAGGKLRKVSLAGGEPEILCATPSFWGADWAEDTIVFGGNRDPLTIGLHRLSPAGGTPQEIVLADASQGESAFAFPEVLPGGEAILFSVWVRNDWRTEVFSPQTGERKIVLEAARQAHYVLTGHLVYEKAGTGTLMAVPFDLSTLELSGESVPVLEGVRQSLRRGVDYGLSSEGSLVYVPRTQYQQELVWVDRKGAEIPILSRQQDFSTPRVSGDGTRVTFTLAEGNRQNIWIHDLGDGSVRRLTDGELNSTQSWMPDGRSIVFQSNRDGLNGLYRQAVDGRGSAESITAATRMSQVPSSFTPDGNALTYLNRGTIWRMSLAGDRQPQKLVDTSVFECCAVISPDGRWFAYVAGPQSIYVSPYPEGDLRWLISGEEGGQQPVWSPTGNELFYRSGNKMMGVSIQTEPVFKADPPQMLFEAPYVANQRLPQVQNYDVSPDGQRFLMIKDHTQPAQIHVIRNWFEELKRLVPTD